jgi:hypothetical protein
MIATLLNNNILLQEYQIYVVVLSYVAARTPRWFSWGAHLGGALTCEPGYAIYYSTIGSYNNRYCM